MSGRKKIVMTKAVRERLQKDIAYGNDMAYWNRYRRDFLILLAVLLLIMLVLVIANILL